MQPDNNKINPFSWKLRPEKTFTICNFTVNGPEGLINPEQIPNIQLPGGLPEEKGLIFSGKGPVWLYAHLAHLAHAFAWVGVHDPRLGGAVVVQRHTAQSPPLGSLIPLAKEGQNV